LTELATVTVELAVIAPEPPKVNVPLFVTSPRVTFAPIVNPFTIVRADAESLDTTTSAVFKVNNPLPRAESLPTCRILPNPPCTVTPPVNVLDPPKSSEDPPVLVSPNAPPSAPPNTTGLNVANVVGAVSVPAPLNVNTPLFVTSPNVTELPPREYAFEKVLATVESPLTVAPAFIVTNPAPKAVLFPTTTTPALITIPPLNVFPADNVI
jgi:hypothetical protein